MLLARKIPLVELHVETLQDRKYTLNLQDIELSKTSGGYYINIRKKLVDSNQLRSNKITMVEIHIGGLKQ